MAKIDRDKIASMAALAVLVGFLTRAETNNNKPKKKVKLKPKKQHKNLLNKLLNSKKEEFGRTMYFKKGQVCVWKGYNPGIIRISEICNNSQTLYKSDSHLHHELHVASLRPATKKEIKKLGRNKAILF